MLRVVGKGRAGGGEGGGGAFVDSKIILLHMKRLNKTESLIFVLLCFLCLKKDKTKKPFRVFIIHLPCAVYTIYASLANSVDLEQAFALS